MSPRISQEESQELARDTHRKAAEGGPRGRCCPFEVLATTPHAQGPTCTMTWCVDAAHPGAWRPPQLASEDPESGRKSLPPAASRVSPWCLPPALWGPRAQIRVSRAANMGGSGAERQKIISNGDNEANLPHSIAVGRSCCPLSEPHPRSPSFPLDAVFGPFCFRVISQLASSASLPLHMPVRVAPTGAEGSLCFLCCLFHEPACTSFSLALSYE